MKKQLPLTSEDAEISARLPSPVRTSYRLMTLIDAFNFKSLRKFANRGWKPAKIEAETEIGK